MSYKDIRKELNNILSLEDARYSQESMEVTDECAKNLIAIQMDNSTSLEHWDNVLKSCINDGILMQHFNLVPIAERNRKKVIIKNMFDRSLSMEEITYTAEVLSLEGVKEFGKKILDGIIHAFQKILEAAAAFLRMISKIFKSVWAHTQSGLYEKNNQKFYSALNDGRGKKEISAKPYKVSLKEIKDGVQEIIKAAEDIKTLSEKELNPGSVRDNYSTVFDIKKNLPKPLAGENITPREAAVKFFFGETKVPKSVKKSAKEWFSGNLNGFDFTACSKTYLEDLKKMEKAGESMMKSANAAIRKIKDAAKKWEAEEKKAGDDRKKAVNSKEYKDEKKYLLKKASLLSSKISALQVYIREFFLLSLDYRTSVYKAAKNVLGEDAAAAKKAEKDAKKNK